MHNDTIHYVFEKYPLWITTLAVMYNVLYIMNNKNTGASSSTGAAFM